MPSKLQRFEILLPLQFNDGAAVPAELVGETLHELELRFHAVSSETQPIQGFWQHEGQSYRDSLVRVWVDVADSAENRAFFADFMERVKVRFQQLEVWITTYPIERL